MSPDADVLSVRIEPIAMESLLGKEQAIACSGRQLDLVIVRCLRVIGGAQEKLQTNPPRLVTPIPNVQPSRWRFVIRRGETVVFSYIVYKSCKQRDAANAKIMKDPRIAAMCDPNDMPFDMKRMLYGGFKAVVEI
jgi:hypothetical protein